MWNSMPSPGFKYRPKLKVWTDGKNNVFDQELFEATSYRHWVYLTKIKGKVVFNNYNYSHATSNHQMNMRALLKKLKIKIDLEVSMHESLTDFYSYGLKYLYKEIFEIEIVGARAKKECWYSVNLNKSFNTRADAIKALKQSIKAHRALGAKMRGETAKQIKDKMLADDKVRLEASRKERRENSNMKKELKPELADLSPIDLTVYDRVESFEPINLGVKNVTK